jgi:anti-sigma factor RsiW
MSQACATWRGDIGAYIVGALSPEAGARVTRHLETCRSCRADYQDLVPVRDWLSRLAADGGVPGGHSPGRLPLQPARSLRHRPRRRWLAIVTAAVTAAAVAAIAVITARPAPPAYQAFNRASGVHGQAQLHATPSGTQISLTITGLPANERCTLVAVSPAGTDVAGTWNTAYDGTAQVVGTTAIPITQLITLRIESPTQRLLLGIPVRSSPQ